jgi:hypothetical protein
VFRALFLVLQQLVFQRLILRRRAAARARARDGRERGLALVQLDQTSGDEPIS